MCTATFLPLTVNSLLFTSNRDEKRTRQPSSPLQIINRNGTQMLCPIDGDAGGTWLGISEQGHLCCLLNGAHHSHVSNPPYKRSRGLILLEALSAGCSATFWQEIELDGIEQFTLIHIDIRNDFRLTEYCWNGEKLSSKQLSQNEPSIWSSSTLYAPEVSVQRKIDWNKFSSQTENRTQAAVWNFHRSVQCPSILLNTTSHHTVSTTQLLIDSEKVVCRYSETLNKVEQSVHLKFIVDYAD